MHYSTIAYIVTIFELVFVSAIPLGPINSENLEAGDAFQSYETYFSETMPLPTTTAAHTANQSEGSDAASTAAPTSTTTTLATITDAPDADPSLRSFIAEAERTKTVSHSSVSIGQQFIQGSPGPIDPDSIHTVGRWPYFPSGWRQKRSE
ncbi:hypothetical protein TWF281_005128 [Arthrobotrys megalospora]